MTSFIIATILSGIELQSLGASLIKGHPVEAPTEPFTVGRMGIYHIIICRIIACYDTRIESGADGGLSCAVDVDGESGSVAVGSIGRHGAICVIVEVTIHNVSISINAKEI